MNRDQVIAVIASAIAAGAEIQFRTAGTLLFGRPVGLRGATVDLVIRGSSRPTAFDLATMTRVRRLGAA